MNSKDFTAKSPGRIVNNLQGHAAFIPNPLPPKVEWTQPLAQAQSKADTALGHLGGMVRHWATPHLLIRTFTVREAVLSSRIEGTEAEISDVFLFQAQPLVPPKIEDVREVNNYVTALEYGLGALANRPLTLGLIREMHSLLMKEVRGHDKTPGEFRKVQAYIAKQGQHIEQATYVPPPPEHLHESLDALEKYIHAPNDLPPLIRLAMIHYQFEAIHPFNDGNGRLGRMLITLLLSVYGLLAQPILYLSDYLEKHRQEYYAHLLAISQNGNWTEWLIFFLNGIAEKAAGSISRGESLLQVREDFQRRVQSTKVSARMLQLVDHLFSSPMIKTANAEKVMRVTRRAAQSAVDRLVSLGILTEITGRSRDRVFEAKAILQVIEADSDIQTVSS